MTERERRRKVRAPAKLAMEVKLSGKDYARVESLNVSANGVYFTSPTHIPLLTKLMINLALPGSGGPGRGREVACEGVVVRTEPETPRDDQGTYEIACYFTSISDDDQEQLETYILGQLAF